MKMKIICLVLFALSLNACTGGNNSNSGLMNTIKGHIDQIMSNRQQTPTDYSYIVILNHPSLFATAQKINGKTLVDENLKQLILAEQEVAIESLKKISPDIKILYRYRFILNGLALIVPASIRPEELQKISTISQLQKVEPFGRPLLEQTQNVPLGVDLNQKNSVTFIGADLVHALGIRGQNIKVGVIDTGIDFTHAMFGGQGTPEAYKAIKPNEATTSFPNNKVVGGIDLCGSEFNEAVFGKNIPIPDSNPLDEQGHGTHVAGTIGGIGDGENTYSGVAPDALLYAIKVFGAEGSTGDHVVIAGLEYSADPNGDLNPEDQLDVVNLSLGSPFGLAHILYSEAVKNLVKGGTVVVASAGNEGAKDYITGSPATSTEALSVAASIDDMPQNINFDVIKAYLPNKPEILIEVKEGAIGQSLADAGLIKGKVVFLGLGNNVTPEMAEKVKGQIALIDRGQITFTDKALAAYQAGATAVIIANNIAGDPFAMSGEQVVPIPAMMITQAMGLLIKEGLSTGDVTMEIKKGPTITKPELIDTLTGFSSKGPRSEDSLLKPEISAPGSLIISAAMGEGRKGVALSGTSMSGPHMAGVMALLKAAHPHLSPLQLKSLAMSSAKTIHDRNGKDYPLSQQGAGRVQVLKAVQTPLVFDTPAISLGEVQVRKQVMFMRSVKVTNISEQTQDLLVSSLSNKIDILTSSKIILNPQETKTLDFVFKINSQNITQLYEEFDGLILFTLKNAEVARIPVLAVVRPLAQIKGKELSRVESAIHLELRNEGLNPGEAYAFNLIDLDPKKNLPQNPQNRYKSTACDLQAAGYRIIEKSVDGKSAKLLQIAAKLYSPVTTWNYCDLSAMIDLNNDGLADYEIAATMSKNLSGLTGTDLVSILLDASKAREIRKNYETALLGRLEAKEDYKEAVLSIQPWINFAHSSIAILQVDLADLPLQANQLLKLQVISQNADTSAFEADDSLGQNLSSWYSIPTSSHLMGYYAMPEVVSLPAGNNTAISLQKGSGTDKLILFYPQNRALKEQSNSQMQVF